MPELPEVETIRLKLEPHLVGRRFDRVEIGDPRLVRPLEPGAVAAELEGERVSALERRGKYLIVRFESGRALLIHLRMTGSLRHAAKGELADDPYRRAVVNLDDGSDIAYRDVRRFGTWQLLEPGELGPYLDERLGVEPLERTFTTRRLAQQLEGRRAPIKAALLDRSIKDALKTAVKRQGASLRDYSTPDGGRGSMQDRFRVYDREGRPCQRCGTPIDKIRTAGRGTWYCPNCQRLEGQAASSSSRRPSRSRRHSSV